MTRSPIQHADAHFLRIKSAALAKIASKHSDAIVNYRILVLTIT